MTTYRDIDGNPCTLDALCGRDPAWAANRIRRLEADVAEATAELWALDKEGAHLGVPCPLERDGWEDEDDFVRRVWGASCEDSAPVVAEVWPHHGTGGVFVWRWHIEEDVGQGWEAVGKYASFRGYTGDHPDGGTYEGVCTTAASAMAAAVKAAERRAAWWAEEGRQVRAALGLEAT